MKSEEQIRDLLEQYKWYDEKIISTPQNDGFIEALKWVLDEEDIINKQDEEPKNIVSIKNFFTDKPLLPPLEKRTDAYSKMMAKSIRLIKLFNK